MKVLNKSLWMLLLVSMSLLLAPVVVRSEAEENADETDEDAVINEEAAASEESDASAASESETDEESPDALSSPFVKTHVLFTQPESTDLPAGRLAKLLIGFHNNGSSNFVVDSIDASFRYPQDFSYYIQNFTTFEVNKVIESDKEATFEYLFTPSETFSSRQFGLTINLRYKNADGKSFINAVFNETINVIEPDEGFDGETFFLYVFLGAIVVLLGIAAQTLFKKKTRSSKSVFSSINTSKVSNGASNISASGVDMEWIPKEHLSTINKSPKVSPRQRRNNASGNSSNDEQ